MAVIMLMSAVIVNMGMCIYVAVLICMNVLMYVLVIVCMCVLLYCHVISLPESGSQPILQLVFRYILAKESAYVNPGRGIRFANM